MGKGGWSVLALCLQKGSLGAVRKKTRKRRRPVCRGRTNSPSKNEKKKRGKNQERVSWGGSNQEPRSKDFGSGIRPTENFPAGTGEKGEQTARLEVYANAAEQAWFLQCVLPLRVAGTKKIAKDKIESGVVGGVTRCTG